MVKLKSIKKKLTNIKCRVQKVLNVKQAEESNAQKQSDSVNKIKPVSNTSSAEGFIPLAAKDSEWVGLEFYNPNFRSTFDDEDDVEEDELRKPDPINLLFPGLRNTDIKGRETSSTTEITKLLVGQKADFRVMKASNKVTLTDNKLSSVREERNASEADVSFRVQQTFANAGTNILNANTINYHTLLPWH